MKRKISIKEVEKTIKKIEGFLGETPFTKEMKERIKRFKERQLIGKKFN